MITSYFAPKRKKENCKNDSSQSSKPMPESEMNAPKRSKQILNTCVFKPIIAADLDNDTLELISHLTCEEWKNALMPHISKKSFHKLAKFVSTERKTKTVYPPANETFTALNLVPLNEVKVVIVGQDPYHQPSQGHGLAFSVKKGVPIPPSLRNIYKELLTNNVGLTHIPNHGFLERWARQGVLMLNSVLTVRRSEAFSHANQGWEDFTDEIIRLVVSKDKDHLSIDGVSKGVVFLLWGKPASKKAETILNRYKNQRNVIICSSHPSPLGATKTDQPFIGSKCFSRANSALEAMGLTPIDWSVDDDNIF